MLCNAHKTVSHIIIDTLSAPTKLRFTAVNFTSATFEWAGPVLYGNKSHFYTIKLSINSSFEVVYNTTSLTTSVNVTGLSRGVEYNISVFCISDNNIMGDRAMILMTLDGTHCAIAYTRSCLIIISLM